MPTVVRSVSAALMEGDRALMEADCVPPAIRYNVDRALVWPSAADRTLVWLLRLTGQTGGTGCLARLYAGILYILLTTSIGNNMVTLAHAGIAALNGGQKLLEAAFSSLFFGALPALTWVPLTSTVVCGRHRYAALLSDVQALLEEVAQAIKAQPIYKVLHRRICILLGATAVVVVIVCVLLFYMMKVSKPCADSPLVCLKTVLFYTSVTILNISPFLISVKFLYITLLLSTGFGAVDAELQSLARDGYLKDWARLARLRGFQDRLSTAFSRLVADMTPELIPTMFYGIAGLVITFLLVSHSAWAGTLLQQLPPLGFMLLTAILLIVVPCETGQHVLDLAAGTRGSLLRLRWEAPRVGQEVSMFQEAVRRDLEQLGDLGYYRLQRSTMVSITSTVITYIIIFAQFKISEA